MPPDRLSINFRLMLRARSGLAAVQRDARYLGVTEFRFQLSGVVFAFAEKVRNPPIVSDAASGSEVCIGLEAVLIFDLMRASTSDRLIVTDL